MTSGVLAAGVSKVASGFVTVAWRLVTRLPAVGETCVLAAGKVGMWAIDPGGGRWPRGCTPDEGQLVGVQRGLLWLRHLG